jgi:hypothetical protein
MVNKITKWMKFLTKRYQTISYNTSVISKDMMWVNAHGQPTKHLSNAMEKMKKIHHQYQSKPKVALMEFITK